MKQHNKIIIMLLAATSVGGNVGAQTNLNMEKKNIQRVADTVKSGYKAIENGVVSGYKAIENGVVNGYTAIQDGVVEGFTRISDAFVKKYLMREGETLEDAKARIAHEEEELHCQSQERIAPKWQK